MTPPTSPATGAAFGALETPVALTAAQIDARARELLAQLTSEESSA